MHGLGCVCLCHTYALSKAFNKDNGFCLFHCNSLLQHAANVPEIDGRSYTVHDTATANMYTKTPLTNLL